MPVELKIAALGAVLLLVHIFAAVQLKTQQYGRGRIERRPGFMAGAHGPFAAVLLGV